MLMFVNFFVDGHVVNLCERVRGEKEGCGDIFDSEVVVSGPVEEVARKVAVLFRHPGSSRSVELDEVYVQLVVEHDVRDRLVLPVFLLYCV